MAFCIMQHTEIRTVEFYDYDLDSIRTPAFIHKALEIDTSTALESLESIHLPFLRNTS